MPGQVTTHVGEEFNAVLGALAGAVERLSEAQDLSTVHEVVSRSARELTGADGATIVIRDGKRSFYADEDAVTPLWKGQTFPIEECISGWTMLYRQPVSVSDIHLDDRIRLETYRSTFVKSLAMVPIKSIAPIGAIGAYWESIHSASELEISLLQSLADATAVTLANPALGRFAINDPLSSQFNRRGFFSRGGERIVDNWDQGQGTIVAFASLDGIESVNRDFGHQAGDEAIRQAGLALRQVCGESAVIGRIEEAAYAVCDSAASIGIHDSAKLEAAVKAATPPAAWSVELALGAATTDPGDHLDLDTLVERANAAMWESKYGSPRPAGQRVTRAAARA